MGHLLETTLQNVSSHLHNIAQYPRNVDKICAPFRERIEIVHTETGQSWRQSQKQEKEEEEEKQAQQANSCVLSYTKLHNFILHTTT